MTAISRKTKTLQLQAALPGQPFFKDSSGKLVLILPDKVLRGRNGKPLLSRNGFIGDLICQAATRFTDCPLRQVYFQNKKGKRIEQVGFAVDNRDGGNMTTENLVALGAMIYYAECQHDQGKQRIKKVVTA